MNKQSGASNIWAIVIVGVLIIAGIAFALNRNEEDGQKDDNNENMNNGMGEMMMGTVELALAAQNNSGQDGKVTITEVNGQTKVLLELKPGPKGVAQPAHIHAGDCTSPGSVKYNLNDVVDGKSETILQPAMHFIHGLGQTVINTHKSKSEPNIYVACGDLKSAFDQASHK